MSEFLILLKDRGEMDKSDTAVQKRIEEYKIWVAEIGEHYVGANRLEPNGVHIVEKDKMITDGPFVETKEIIVGYVMIQAKNLEQAVKLANNCPLLKDCEIFVRPILSS